MRHRHPSARFLAARAASLACAASAASAQLTVSTFTLPGGGAGNGYVSITSGDIDADFDIDLVCGHRPVQQPTITTLRNDGTGNFPAGQQASFSLQTTFSHVYDHELADLDNDGDLDVASACYPFNLECRFNDGLGNFTGASTTTFSGGYMSGLDVGDLNGDGLLDVVTTWNSVISPNNFIVGHLNLGGGAFGVPGFGGFLLAMPTNLPLRLTVGDIDGDGRADVVVQDYYSVHLVRANPPGGTGPLSSLQQSYPLQMGPVLCANLNFDNRADVAVTDLPIGSMFAALSVASFPSPLAPTFGTPTSPGGVWAVAAGDIDFDGDADVVTSSGSGSIALGLNDGFGNLFNPAPASAPGFPIGQSVRDLVIADLDGSTGARDVATINNDQTITRLLIP